MPRRRNRPRSKNNTAFIGLDLGDKYSQLTVLDGQGDLIEETRLPTTRTGLERKFSLLPKARVAMEVGTHSRWASQLIEELGHEVLVANASKLRAIYDNPRKGDKADAETLARLDPSLLSPIQHRSPEAQADLSLIRSRDVLVRSRTLMINHARGTVKACGARLPSCSADSFHYKVREAVPEGLQPAILPILEMIASLTEWARSRRSPTCSPWKTPPASRRAGRCDRRSDWCPEGTNRPNRTLSCASPRRAIPILRQLLVGSAHYIIGPFGPDCDLRRWGLKLAARGGKNARKRAAVAVARKLAILLHRLWKTGEVYDPFYQSRGEDEASAVALAAA